MLDKLVLDKLEGEDEAPAGDNVTNTFSNKTILTGGLGGNSVTSVRLQKRTVRIRIFTVKSELLRQTESLPNCWVLLEQRPCD